MLQDGVAFEAHPQNTVARFSLAPPYELRGFVIRDFGGLRVHPPTLLASTGVALDAIPGHRIIAETLDDVYTPTYHSMIYNHIQQLVRVLGLHYNGKGWEVVRLRLREVIPHGHALEKAWLDEEAKTIPGRCYVRTSIRALGHVSFSLALVRDTSLLIRNISITSIYIDHSQTSCITLAQTKEISLTRMLRSTPRPLRAILSLNFNLNWARAIQEDSSLGITTIQYGMHWFTL